MISRVNPILVAVCLQIALLSYHQLTTFMDLFPFNGARFYSRKERAIEMTVNAALMGTAIVGMLLEVRGLMTYASVYYFVLFAVELIIWWIPYFSIPAGIWRQVYNWFLAVGTSDFAQGDTLSRWLAVYHRIHSQTMIVVPVRADRITPNLEHTLLHAGTLATALATWWATSSAVHR